MTTARVGPTATGDGVSTTRHSLWQPTNHQERETVIISPCSMLPKRKTLKKADLMHHPCILKPTRTSVITPNVQCAIKVHGYGFLESMITMFLTRCACTTAHSVLATSPSTTLHSLSYGFRLANRRLLYSMMSVCFYSF